MSLPLITRMWTQLPPHSILRKWLSALIGRVVSRIWDLPLTDVNAALDKISALAPPFVVTVDVQRQPPPDFVNRLSKPVAEWLAQNPSYVRETLLENGILIYRERTPATAKR
jgi:hypothetical protein